MKKTFLSIIIASVIPFSVAFAGDGEQRAPHKDMGEKFAKELNLTAEQKAKIDDIKSKHRESRAAEREEIKSVLTPEQQAKLETMKKDHPRHERMGKKAGQETAPPVKPVE